MELKDMMDALQALGKKVEDLVKVPHPDCITRAETDKVIEAYLAKSHPAKPAMVLPGEPGQSMAEAQEILLDLFGKFKKRPEAYEKAAPWTSEYGKQFGDMRKFLIAVARRDPKVRFLELDGQKAAADAMTEGTTTSGGFLVPTEFNYTVIKLLYAATSLRRLANLVPMSTWKRTLPRMTSNLSVYWVSEFGSKTATKPALEQFTQTAKVMACVIKSSDELLRDSAINLQQFLGELVAGSMAREEERVGYVGNTGAGDPFMGVLYVVGSVTATMAGASLDYDDLIDQQAGLAEAHQPNSTWVMRRAALKLIMKLKAAGSGEPVWHAPREGNPGTILERPYVLSDLIPITLGTGAQTAILLGDFKNLWVSDREGIIVKVSNEASDWVSGALDSAFMTDQTWMRFAKAMSIDFAYPAAFTHMLVS